jgi:hypothetical protein
MRQSHTNNESTVNNELAMNDRNDENLCPLPLTAPPAGPPSIASAAEGSSLPSGHPSGAVCAEVDGGGVGLAAPEPDADGGEIPVVPSSCSPVVPSSTHRGLGKVARLPKIIRDQLNQMILDGLPYVRIIEAIGEPANGLDVDHIRKWKRYGYQNWLLELQRNDNLRLAREYAQDVVEQKAGSTLQEAGRTIVADQLYKVLQCFDPATFAEALQSKPHLYLRIVNAVARLSEGEAVCGHRRAQESLIEAKLRPAGPPDPNAIVSHQTLMEIARLIKLL